MPYDHIHSGLTKSAISMWEVYVYIDDDYQGFGQVRDELQPIVDQLEAQAQLGSYSEEEDDALVCEIRRVANQADDGMESPLDEIVTDIEIGIRSMPYGSERDELLGRIPEMKEVRRIIIRHQRDMEDINFHQRDMEGISFHQHSMEEISFHHSVEMMKTYNDFINDVEGICMQIGMHSNHWDEILDLKNENTYELEWANDVLLNDHDHQPDRWEEFEEWDPPIYEKFLIMSKELTEENISDIIRSEDHRGVNSERWQDFITYVDGLQYDTRDDNVWISVLLHGFYDAFDRSIDIDSLFDLEFYTEDPYE